MMILDSVLVISEQYQIQQLARQVGRQILAADNLDEALDIITTTKPDLIILDHHHSPIHIRRFLDRADKNCDIPVVIVDNTENDSELSADLRQIDSYDYLQGPKDHHRLKEIANNIKNKTTRPGRDKTANHFFVNDFAASVCMVGCSKAIRHNLKMIELVANSRCNPVLIVGKTGTGKELAAKAIHFLRHFGREFVAVNCAALTANLLESELFGHVKGSFTGADREKTGLLELAENGTIFLDEISEMPLDLQAKLLRVLQEKEFRKVGGTKTITCSATIIASTNRNLHKQVRAKRFRNDLYHRLNIFPINLAPLKSAQRKNDVPLLAEYFLKTSTICPEKIDKITSLTKLAVEVLLKHDWSGNVRELQNVIERAILLETTDKIGLSSIVIDTGESTGLSEAAMTDKIKDFSLEEAEHKLIARALQETGWQKTQAAMLLGITRATLYAKVKQYHIERGSYIAKETKPQTPVHALPEPLLTH